MCTGDWLEGHAFDQPYQLEKTGHFTDCKEQTRSEALSGKGVAMKGTQKLKN